MDESSDDVVVIQQSRTMGFIVGLMGAVCLGGGLWRLHGLMVQTPEWWLTAAVTSAFAVAAGVGLVEFVRPVRILITADGLDVSGLGRAESLAWEEVAGIGHWMVARGSGVQRIMGIQIGRMDGTELTLGGGWPGGVDATVRILVEAWEQFRALAKDTEPSEPAPPAAAAAPEPAPAPARQPEIVS